MAIKMRTGPPRRRSKEDREPARVLLAVVRLVLVEDRPVARVETQRDLFLERDLEAAAGAERHQGLVLVDEVVGLGPDLRGADADAHVRSDDRARHEPEHEAEAGE